MAESKPDLKEQIADLIRKYPAYYCSHEIADQIIDLIQPALEAARKEERERLFRLDKKILLLRQKEWFKERDELEWAAT